jgi:hypothetical protein
VELLSWGGRGPVSLAVRQCEVTAAGWLTSAEFAETAGRIVLATTVLMLVIVVVR